MEKEEVLDSQIVKIGYQEYIIERRINKIMSGKDECVGLYLPQEAKILISSALTGNERVQTTIHEIFHGLSTIYHIELTERQVDQIATALVIFIRDNPSFMSTLFQQGEDDERKQRLKSDKAKRASTNARRIRRPKGTVRK